MQPGNVDHQEHAVFLNHQISKSHDALTSHISVMFVHQCLGDVGNYSDWLCLAYHLHLATSLIDRVPVHVQHLTTSVLLCPSGTGNNHLGFWGLERHWTVSGNSFSNKNWQGTEPYWFSCCRLRFQRQWGKKGQGSFLDSGFPDIFSKMIQSISFALGSCHLLGDWQRPIDFQIPRSLRSKMSFGCFLY